VTVNARGAIMVNRDQYPSHETEREANDVANSEATAPMIKMQLR
jgi:hypothetical protein